MGTMMTSIKHILIKSGRQIAINAAGCVMAGLMYGPDAPVCVLIGGFVSGALAVWEMGSVWN